jgi:hypothetical protein
LTGSVSRRVGASHCIGKQNLSSQLPVILRNNLLSVGGRVPELVLIASVVVGLSVRLFVFVFVRGEVRHG